MSEPVDTTPSETERMFRARKNLTYLLLFSIVMFFAGLSSAYVVSKGSTDYWVTFRIPKAFYYSTAIILASSLSIQLALVMAKRGKGRATAGLLVLTLALGIGFTWSQFKGWGELIDNGYNVVGKVMNAKGTYGTDFTILRKGLPLELADSSYYAADDPQHTRPLNAEIDEYKNTASSYFYILTAAHWIHLLVGLIALVFMAVNALLGRYTAEDHVGLWQGTLYWHFLAGLWVYLLSFLAFVH
jgi:cytochrome c oxidase subunit 3